MEISVNVNHYVKVKLNDVGIKELERQHNELAMKLPKLGKFKKPKTDSEGYSKFQFHELMRKFGHMMKLGYEPPFDMDIVFGEYKEVVETNPSQ